MGSYEMNRLDVIGRLNDSKIIPIFAFETVEDGAKVCELLFRNNLKVVEITFRTAAASETIKALARKFPDMLIGAGTILNRIDLEMAVAAGAKFAVAPGCNPNIIKSANELRLPFFPGVATPTDIECANELGVKVMKFFPAEACGGVKMLRAMGAPYRHLGIKFLPTGGITASNLPDYLAVDNVLAVGGTWLAPAEMVKAKQWDKIDDLVKEAVAIANT
jgi:2-dehydro-3-deoxyphosphogluconate aldolase/(4S)-4-hydroxy-2-oxoglutarate aldolase